ncbi:META domain-containing protein [Algoriphagus sp.]|uniref:META domain-containing protein n=1 Tax=Algoriphagus sp. TaxID=1872435 RepID=UPI00391B1880
MERIPLEIEGFTFKPTFIQKILVRKIENTTTGEIRRKLIRVLAEEKDYYELIEGGWKVKKYMGEDLPNENFPKGQSVGILPGIRMAGSSDGCNHITLEIQKVGPDKILSFGTTISTQIACPNVLLIPAFPGITRNFKREGNVLTFYSENEGEVAVWEKLN